MSFNKLLKRNLLSLLVTLAVLFSLSFVAYATTLSEKSITIPGSATSTITGDGTTTTIGAALKVSGTTTLSGILDIRNNNIINIGTISPSNITINSSSTFNDSAGSNGDFRLKGTNDDGLIFADVSENQVVIHGDSDPNYGSLFVQGRTSGSGADQDIVTTLGEDGEDIQLNGNNTGIVQNVQIQAGNWTSPNPVSPDKVANLRIEGVPTFGANVTPNNTYSLLIQNRAATEDHFVVDRNGNVGIGTSTPSSILDIIGNIEISGTSTLGTIVSGTWNGTAISSQYGGTGKDVSNWTGFLRVDSGTWSTSTPTAGAGGSDSQIQFNNSDVLAGDSNLTWTTSTQLLSLTGTSSFIGDISIGTTTMHSSITKGISIDSVGDDGIVFALKDSTDVNHGLLNPSGVTVEEDDFMFFRKRSAALGGLLVGAVAEDGNDGALDNTVFHFSSSGGEADTDKSTTGAGLFEFFAEEHDGNGNRSEVTANGNLFAIRARTGGTNKTNWLLDVDGDSFQRGNLLNIADDGGSIGVSGTGWSDLYLASGGVINWGDGDVTLTQQGSPTSTLELSGELDIRQGTLSNLHRSSSEGHHDLSIGSDNDAVLQIASDNGGSVGTGLVLTNMESGTDGRHWVVSHKGTNANNRFSIGYLTSSADEGTNLMTGDEDFVIETDGDVGIGTESPGATLDVNGSLSKNSGSFDITHPDPEKAEDGYRLSHYFVESPTAGDNIYRFEVDVSNGEATIDLPDYFQHLNENSQVWVSAVDSFGSAYGEVNSSLTEASIKANQDGKYNVLIIGTRKDEAAVDYFNTKGVEYQK